MDLAGVRDIAVVVLAAVALVATLILLITGMLAWRLLAAIRTDVTPIIHSARETVDTVRDTTELVSDVVKDGTSSTAGALKKFRRVLQMALRWLG
ncbi:MAG: hypothetical protein OXG17_00970 [Chloroflexi bacterium]|nr:hypothetical protein [Chloroflexota bacterium]